MSDGKQTLEEQLEDLYRRYAAGLGSYFLARLGDPELSEELTSRVFILAVQRFEQCRGNPGGWLWAIAQSVLSRHFRELRRTPPPAISTEQHDPHRVAESNELHRRLTELIAELNEQQQQIVYLKYFQDLGNIEIAEATGLTPVHVAVVLHRTLKRLRELIEAPRESTAWPKQKQTI